MDVMDIKNSLKICVKKCPDRKLETVKDICKFYNDTGSQLCHDKPNSNFSACLDPDRQEILETSIYCPERPVNKSIPVLNRCIPQTLKDASETIIANLYGIINSWDLIEQILGDLYKTWKEILALSFLAFGKILSLLIHNSHRILISTCICSSVPVYDCHLSFNGYRCYLDCNDSRQLCLHR